MDRLLYDYVLIAFSPRGMSIPHLYKTWDVYEIIKAWYIHVLNAKTAVL